MAQSTPQPEPSQPSTNSTTLNQQGSNNEYNNNTGSGKLIINPKASSSYTILNLSGDPVQFGSMLHLKAVSQGGRSTDNTTCQWKFSPKSLLKSKPTQTCEVAVAIRDPSDNLLENQSVNLNVIVEISEGSQQFVAQSFVTVQGPSYNSFGYVKALPQLTAKDIELRASRQWGNHYRIDIVRPNMTNIAAMVEVSTDGGDYQNYFGYIHVDRPRNDTVLLKFRSMTDNRVVGPFAIEVDFP